MLKNGEHSYEWLSGWYVYQGAINGDRSKVWRNLRRRFGDLHVTGGFELMIPHTCYRLISISINHKKPRVLNTDNGP